jgi:hypothetical protein
MILAIFAAMVLVRLMRVFAWELRMGGGNTPPNCPPSGILVISMTIYCRATEDLKLNFGSAKDPVNINFLSPRGSRE